MPNYRPYPDYQPTNIDWLGNIPVDWNVAKVKHVSKVFNGATPKSGELQYWDGNISWVTPADFGKSDDPYIYSGSRSITLEGLNSCGTSLVPAGSVVISSRAPIGTVGIAGQELCTNQGCKSLVPTQLLDSKFLYYLLKSSKEQLNILGKGTTFLELSSDEMGTYRICLPSEVEQKVISLFLDRETAKIDQLIAKQQQLIELLKEKRQAVISHAVTKGLNPDVKMKASGVEWLGDVPEHWEIKRIGLLFSESSSKASSDEELDLPILSVSIHHGISDKELTEEESDRKLQRSDDKSLYKVVHENYLAYNMMRAWQGGFGAAKISGLVSPAYVICEPKTSLDSYFFELILRTANAITELKRYSKGITDFRLRLYWDEFKNVCVPVPPDTEIQEILKSIEETNTKYIHLMAKAERQIGLLRERRAALISAAVTGKIDVREVA